MSKENEIQGNFAYLFISCLFSHNKRLFEAIDGRLQDYEQPLMCSDFMNDREEREAFLILKESIKNIASMTCHFSDSELEVEFLKTLKLLGSKKESEVSNE